jgi:phospholipase D1/2
MGSAVAECTEALDKPALKSSWKKIQSIAKDNSDIYEELFDFIPRDALKSEISTRNAYSDNKEIKNKKDQIPASIWPILAANKNNSLADREKMPFSESFWREYKNAHL